MFVPRPPIEDVLDRVAAGKLAPADAMPLMESVSELKLPPKGQGDTGRARSGSAGRIGMTGAASNTAANRLGQRLPVIEQTLGELDSLVGLEMVKEMVLELGSFTLVQERRRAAGLKSDGQTLHMVFKGNPGTGKTTVARAVARLFCRLGLLEKGHLLEVERADLVGEYIGHTAQKVREQVKKAMGGVLFIDEAYSLARGGEKDFGKEAIDTLVKAMEDHRHELIIILAGYRDEMDWFLRHNPGLRSRLPIIMDFPDYSVDELLDIGNRIAAERDYLLTTEATRHLRNILKLSSFRDERRNGNARAVRNLIEKTIRRQAVRLASGSAPSRNELMHLTAVDVEEAWLQMSRNAAGEGERRLLESAVRPSNGLAPPERPERRERSGREEVLL